MKTGWDIRVKNIIPHKHKKNWNRAVARFQFFIANAKKESEIFAQSFLTIIGKVI
ncbi:MAG: hypothetical protein ACRC0Q_02995 [Kurthia gibsonii]|uniref:Uncharacterized protein n=1 Tax=Kurthia gibsonii TaxID=33946 RepID=A0ABU9LIJ1_9BACL|nr:MULTISPECIES: hypothetical protein [Kurthia]MEB6111591.1 hypothetical protein [Kurthia gibsonii]WIL39521.1 hypothetical protein QN089_04445 [Kurthia sp. YJT4]HZG12136.1 hypothetical protein [Kurthia gibsonii]